MYTNTDVSVIIPAAEEFVMTNDRALYDPFFEAAEKFMSSCSECVIMLGGKIACDLALGRPLNKDSYMWELYCDDVYETTKKLADAIAGTKSAHVPARTTSLRTDIRHREFTIFVNARMLFKIYSLDRYRGVKLATVMPETIRVGYFGNSIRCISDELLLIDLYRTLYSPSRLAEWDAALITERKLSENTAANTVVGGADLRAEVTKIRAEITEKLPKLDENAVIVGDYAFDALGYGSGTKNNKLQIISATSPDNIIAMIGSKYKESTAKVKLTYEEHRLNIPSDFQIRKYTVYASDRDSQSPVMEIFNSSKFEMIPWVDSGSDAPKHKQHKYGNPWVLLKFIYVDIWTLRTIMKMKGSDLGGRIAYLLSVAADIRAFISENLTATFQLSNYVGVYTNEATAKKKLIKEIGERFPSYYPARKMEAVSEIVGGNGSVDSTNFAVPISTPVDLTQDFGTKFNILRKVTGSKKKIRKAHDIVIVLATFAKTEPQSKWGFGKNQEKFFFKNEMFLHHLARLSALGPLTIIDIGCGDGTDIPAIASRYDVARGICADIADTRDESVVNLPTGGICQVGQPMEFVKITPGQPLEISDETADVVLMFHCIHHMIDDIDMRLRDAIRMTKKGGLIFIKDHDVTDPIIESNVDLEHLAYMAPGQNVGALIKEFRAREPMCYHARVEIHGIMEANGCELVETKITSKYTNVYSSVFRKV